MNSNIMVDACTKRDNFALLVCRTYASQCRACRNKSDQIFLHIPERLATAKANELLEYYKTQRRMSLFQLTRIPYMPSYAITT
jgi:hypothetical protein